MHQSLAHMLKCANMYNPAHLMEDAPEVGYVYTHTHATACRPMCQSVLEILVYCAHLRMVLR